MCAILHRSKHRTSITLAQAAQLLVHLHQTEQLKLVPPQSCGTHEEYERAMAELQRYTNPNPDRR